MVKNLINFFIAVGLLLPQFLGLAVGLLHFFTAWASYYQYWLYKITHWWAQFGEYFRNAGAVAERRSRRWGPGAKAKDPKTWFWNLKLKRLSVRTANNEGFKCSQLKSWLLLHHLAEENEIGRLQLRLFFLDNNRSENDICWAPGPTGPGKTSGSLYSWNNKGCYDW